MRSASDLDPVARWQRVRSAARSVTEDLRALERELPDHGIYHGEHQHLIDIAQDLEAMAQHELLKLLGRGQGRPQLMPGPLGSVREEVLEYRDKARRCYHAFGWLQLAAALLICWEIGATRWAARAGGAVLLVSTLGRAIAAREMR